MLPNPIAVQRWPFRSRKDDYVLWVGRMDPVKGAHRAIEAARLAGRRLVPAGPIQPGQRDYFRQQIKPHLDGRTVVGYLGEVAGRGRYEVFAGAAALLMAVRWRDLFGIVMIEALACGTPVIAFPEGAAAEIVIDGHNGMLAHDEGEMARANSEIGSVNPAHCRASAADRYDPSIATMRHEPGLLPPVDVRPPSPAKYWTAPGRARNTPSRSTEKEREPMSIPADQPRGRRRDARNARDRDLARVLRLLDAHRTGALTIDTRREHGVEAPALAIYELQLAGHEIERARWTYPDGRVTLGYRLRDPSGGPGESREGDTSEGKAATNDQPSTAKDRLMTRVDRDRRSLGARVDLREGSRARVRQGIAPIRELLLRGFERLSPQSCQRRFLAPMSRVERRERAT